jgi:hypothetical protein
LLRTDCPVGLGGHISPSVLSSFDKVRDTKTSL